MEGHLRVLALVPALMLLVVVQDALGVWRYPDSAVVCPADTLVVMGAAQYDGEPSPALKRRLDRALELYRGGCAARVIVSGGRRQGDRYSEGAAGVRYLEAQGVPTSALVSETEATTSYENLRNSLPLLGDDRIVIVTDDLHAYRTHWLAARLGLDATVATVETGGETLRYGVREMMILTAYHLGVVR